MASVTLDKVNKVFGSTHIIKDVDLEIGAGEFVVFVGPSGCGKSTLLRLIAGLESISDGELSIGETVVNELPPRDRGVGMVFQSYALYPHMTVEENVGFSLKLAKVDRVERKSRVDQALEILQLTDVRDARPNQLSGGQRQRVAIGRSIVRKPAVFLFDEPLSNLDTALRVQMRLEISRLHRRLQNTVVYVTHDQIEAMTLADRVIVLEAGTVQQIGAPLELYEQPANKFVAGFLGTPQMGFLSAEAIASEDDCLVVRVMTSGDILRFPGHSARIGPLTIGIRPEDCRLSDPEVGVVAGEVLQVERLGSDTFAFVDSGGDEPLAVRVEPGTAVSNAGPVGVTFDPQRCHLFDEHDAAITRSANN